MQTYDIQISTDRFISNLKARSAVETIRGVKKSETVVNMAVELKHENLTEFAMVYGLNPGSDMWRIMDLYGTFYEPPDDGIILNTRVAEKTAFKGRRHCRNKGTKNYTGASKGTGKSSNRRKPGKRLLHV